MRAIANRPEYITLLSVGKPRLSTGASAWARQYITLLSVGKPRRWIAMAFSPEEYITLLSVGKPRPGYLIRFIDMSISPYCL